MLQNQAECIILAGGLGTRLRGTIGDLPKCMAPVGDKPFLHYLFRYIAAHGISRVVLSLGYRAEAVIGWLGGQQWPFRIDWVIEEEPLGTGGGMQLALRECSSEHVFVLNGDTMFTVALADLQTAHEAFGAEATLALKTMRDFERYGTVVTDEHSRILSFEEKAPKREGAINGGIYLISRKEFLARGLPLKFSFEKDYLERFTAGQKFFGFSGEPATDAYFIDIGVPDDYARAQQDFQTLFPE